MAVITLSRTLGSEGDTIAQKLCQELGYQLFDKRLILKAAQEAGITSKEIGDLSEDSYHARNLFERLFGRAQITPYMGMWPDGLAAVYTLEDQVIFEEDLLDLVQKAVRWAYQIGKMVIVGRGSQVILSDRPNVLHIRLDAPYEIRLQRVMEQLRRQGAGQPDEEQAKKFIRERDAASADYIQRFYHADWTDPLLYHLVLNTGRLDLNQAVRLIVQMTASLPDIERDQDVAAEPELTA